MAYDRRHHALLGLRRKSRDVVELGIMRIVDKQKGLRIHAGPGHWNDPDMMEVGNGMTVAEDRAHFSMWAMLAAPLIAGNDLRNAGRQTMDILTNKEVIAVDQDALGIEAFPAVSEDGLEVWAKPLANDEWAICFLNRSGEAKKVAFDWKENFIKDDFAGPVGRPQNRPKFAISGRRNRSERRTPP